MSTSLRIEDYYISPDDYLAAERVSDTRHEYVAGKIYAMAGASVWHERICANITGELRAQLRGKRCEAFGSNIRVRIENPGMAEFYYYPDAMVECSGLPNGTHYAEEPVVIFEVLSPETERIDLGEKLAHYRSLPSVRVYAVVNQHNPAVTIYRRRGETWEMEFLGRTDGTLELPEIGCRLPMAAIYDRMGFS